MHKKNNKFVHGESFKWGVMMSNNTAMSIAIRRQDNSVAERVEKKSSLINKNTFFNIPVIRGLIRFLEGSTDQFRGGQYIKKMTKTRGGKNLKSLSKKRFEKISPYVSVFIILLLGFILYFMIPTLATFLLKKTIKNILILNSIEIFIRIMIFLITFCILSKSADVKKSAKYHSAEHKVLFCYLNEEPLTIEKAKKYPIYNPSCGTTLIITLIIVSIPFFIWINYENILLRIIIMLALLPILIGISFDLTEWLGRNESKLGKILTTPGIYLQRLNTKEPDDKHLEIAIIALKNLLQLRK